MNKTLKVLLRIVEISAIVGTLAVALLAYLNTLDNRSTILSLQTTNSQLLYNQTMLQEKIAQLMENQTTGKVGKAIQIQSMAKTANSTGDFLTIWVQNVGTGALTLDSLYVNGILQSSGLNVSLPVSNTKPLTSVWSALWAAPSTVDVKVVTTDGTFIEATQTVPGS
jgi:hypothetical protein